MSNSDTRPRLILFGIDGATFDVIKPAVAAGKLPNIGRLMQQGSWRVLKSIIPPITGAAWPTIMTGVNPGKHGLFEFVTLQKNSYLTRTISSLDRKTLAIWELLNQAGLRVGVLNVPVTYPPEPIEGWMISGMMGAPEFGEAACYPRQLADEVRASVGFYPMIPAHKAGGGGQDYNFAALQDQITSRTLVAMELLRRYPVDVLIVVCSYTDHVQHRFWKQRSFTTSQGEHIEDVIVYAYQQADHFLGQLLDFCGEQATTFIVSDHGGGPQDGYLNMERFLMDTGLTVLKSGRRNFGAQGLSLLQRIRNLFPEKLLRKLPLVWYRKTKSFFEEEKLSCIDWPHTRALNIGSYLGLRLNVKGREPQGCIAAEDYEEQRQEIQALLQDCRHPATGAPVFQVHTREELYHGPYVSKAPDLVGIVGEGRIHLVRVPNPGSTSAFIWGQQMKKVDPYRRTGAHQMEGVLIAAGPHLHAGSLDTEAQLVDIVPTMLYALGLAVPKYCDGRVLTDLFASDFVDAHSPVYADIDMHRQAEDSEDSAYSQQESDQVKKRLRDLGYLD